MKHVNPLYRDKQKLKAVATMLGYTQRWYQEADDDRLDVLMWTKDKQGNIVNWNPDVIEGDCFKMCLDLDIKITLDKEKHVVTAEYRAPNGGGWASFVNGLYENNDFMPVVRRIALSAAYELAKVFIRQQEQQQPHDTLNIHPTSG